MGIASSLRDAIVESRGVTVVGDRLWRSINASIRGTAGMEVTEQSAMGLSAVWGCVRIQSSVLASLPLFVYWERSDGGKDKATGHPWYERLHSEPNPEMNSFSWRQSMAANQILWGNGYSRIEESEGDSMLWPLLSAYMRMERSRVTNELRYLYDEPGASGEYRPSEILRVPGLTLNGVNGLSAIAYHRQSLGLAMAAQQFGANFFENDATPGFTLSTEQELTKEAVDRVKALWVANHQGPNKAGAPAVLHSGLKPVPIGMPLVDAQFVEQRKLAVAEVCRIFGVPPHLVMDLERATFSNIEHQSIEYVVFHLTPWLTCWEQALRQQLFTREEKRRFFVKFKVDGLLRGDSASRWETYQKGIQNGVYSPNDVLALEDMNPVPGGNRRFVNGNMVPIDQAGEAFTGNKQSRSVEPAEGGTHD